MEWRPWKEETRQLWTKAVDRATASGFLARRISLAPGQMEESRLYSVSLCQEGQSEARLPGGLPKGWDHGYGSVQGTARSFISIVKYNLLKSTYARSTYLEPG